MILPGIRGICLQLIVVVEYDFRGRMMVIHTDLFFEERNDLASGSSRDPIQRR